MEKMLDGICSCKQGLERLDSFVGFLADPGRPLTPNKAKPSLGMEVVITRQPEAIQYNHGKIRQTSQKKPIPPYSVRPWLLTPAPERLGRALI